MPRILIAFPSSHSYHCTYLARNILYASKPSKWQASANAGRKVVLDYGYFFNSDCSLSVSFLLAVASLVVAASRFNDRTFMMNSRRVL